VTAPTFEPKGAVSVFEACLTVIRRIEPKDGITYAQAVTDVQELTVRDDISKSDIMAPMNRASKALRRIGEPGVRNRSRVGWERETPEGMVASGENHERKARRQVKWAVEAVEKVDVEVLGWDARGRRDGVLHRNRKQNELDDQRAKRKRPLPPAEGDQVG
jgi:hypothetical protein